MDELGLAYFDEIEQFVLSRIQAARNSAGLQEDQRVCLEHLLRGDSSIRVKLYHRLRMSLGM